MLPAGCLTGSRLPSLRQVVLLRRLPIAFAAGIGRRLRTNLDIHAVESDAVLIEGLAEIGHAMIEQVASGLVIHLNPQGHCFRLHANIDA